MLKFKNFILSRKEKKRFNKLFEFGTEYNAKVEKDLIPFEFLPVSEWNDQNSVFQFLSRLFAIF